MLDAVRLALRISSDAYDQELRALIDAALLDLRIAGVTAAEPGTDTDDELLRRAVITYVRCHFGTPPYYDKLLASYDEQKAQLQMATGYTDWGLADADP